MVCGEVRENEDRKREESESCDGIGGEKNEEKASPNPRKILFR